MQRRTIHVGKLLTVVVAGAAVFLRKSLSQPRKLRRPKP
jgi:hypothetical protein